MFFKQLHLHDAFIWLGILLPCILFTYFTAAAQSPRDNSGATSSGWFGFMSSLSGFVKRQGDYTLGHGRGIGARQITKLIFPGLHRPRNDINEGEFIGCFKVENVEAVSHKHDLIYKAFMLKPITLQGEPLEASRLLVWFHGNSELASHVAYEIPDTLTRFSHCSRFNAGQWSVLVIEYPGFGASDGLPQAYILEDMVEAWFCWLQGSGYRITLFGRSIGTAVATYWAAEYRADGLILDAPYSSIADIAASIVRVPVLSFFTGMIFRNTLETKSFIDKIRVPTLVITRGQDEVIPEFLGIKQYEAIRSANDQPTTHISLKNSGHNHFFNGREQEAYDRSIAEFLSSDLVSLHGQDQGACTIF